MKKIPFVVKQLKSLETKYIITIICAIILGASILGYGYMGYKNKREAFKLKVATDAYNRKNLNDCLQFVADKESKIDYSFAKTMEQFTYAQNNFQNIITQQKANCFKQFPAPN